MKSNTLLLAIFFVFPFTISAQQIDTQKSKVIFEIGNMRVNTVSGSFSGMNGSVKFNPTDLSNAVFDVCIDASTVNTGNRKRDEHLREADFFSVENHPRICYTSDEIIKTATGYLTRGKLTIKGTTRIVSIPFTWSDNLLQGTFTLNRLDYEVGERTGTLMVSNPVEITIQCYLR